MTSRVWSGVWISAEPLTINEGAKGMSVLRIDVPISVVRHLEWEEEGKPYREWLVPAKMLNPYGPPVMHDHDLKGATSADLREYVAFCKDAGQLDDLREFRRDYPLLRSLGWIKA